MFAFEVLNHLIGDVADGVASKEWFDLIHGPADGFVVARALIEFNVGEVVRDHIVEAGVADNFCCSVLLAEA